MHPADDLDLAQKLAAALGYVQETSYVWRSRHNPEAYVEAWTDVFFAMVTVCLDAAHVIFFKQQKWDGEYHLCATTESKSPWDCHRDAIGMINVALGGQLLESLYWGKWVYINYEPCLLTDMLEQDQVPP